MQLRISTASSVALLTLVAAQAVAGGANTGRQRDPATLGRNVLIAPGGSGGNPVSILYAPSEADDPAFRAAVAAITGGAVDYFDTAAATPGLALLSNYDCVFTWTNGPHFDNVAFGDNLADFVDGSGVVVLGPFSTYTKGNFLSGRIMTAGYSPVYSPTGLNHGSSSDYAGDGVTRIHEGFVAYESAARDILALQGAGAQDGSYVDGEIAHAHRPDFNVVYSNGGGMAPVNGSGDWPLLIANSCRAGQGGPTLYAVDDAADSLYTLNMSTGGSSLVGSCGADLSFSGMAWDSWHRTMYVSDVVDGVGYSLARVDLDSGAVTIVGSQLNSTDIHGLAFDSTNNVLYGADIACLSGTGGLATVNRETGGSTCIGGWGTTENIRGLAYNSTNDTLYGADEINLYTVNRATGAATVVGQHGAGLGDRYIGLEYDASSATLFGAGSGDGNLYTIDTTTGLAILIGNTGLLDVSGLAFTGGPGEPCGVFCDDFETDDTSAWSATVPPIVVLPHAADLLWYYSADAPGAGGYPIDLGPQALGTMTHVGTKPGLSLSAGPNGQPAWGPFASSGFFKNPGSSTTYATGDYTVVVMFQKQPYAPGLQAYILGYDDVSNAASAHRLEGGHVTNGGGGDAQTFTWSANQQTLCDSGGPASPDMNWYIFGAYKSPGSQSIVSTFLTTVGSLTDIATGTLSVGAIANIGDEIRLGGQNDSFTDQGMRGYIWKAMAWTGQPSRFDIYAWAMDQAGP